MRPFFRSTLVFAAGLTLTLGLPSVLAFLGRPCHHVALQRLLFWSAVGTAFAYYLTYRLLRRESLGRALLRASVLGAALSVVLSIQLPSLFGAIGRSKQVKTIAVLRHLGVSLDRRPATLPTGQRFGPVDAWGNPILVATQPGRYVIVSFGECGVPDGPDPWRYQPGPTARFDADVVYSNGQLLRYPEGVQQ